MENYRIENLEYALRFLVERLSENVNRVKLNAQLSRDMVNNNPYSDKLENIQKENRSLLNENKDLLNLQLGIRKYLSIYRDTVLKQQEEIIKNERSAEEWFELTVTGKIDLNDSHPMINNLDFLNDILNYHQEKEEYEKCNTIANMINSIKQVC